MKVLHYLAILLAILPSTLRAQNEQPEAGFLQFVNLISLPEPTFIKLASFDLNGGEPVAPGDTSGILAIKPSEYTFTLSNKGAKPRSISGPLSIANGSNVVVICYDETKELNDGTTESKIKFNLLTESLESEQPRLSLVSLLKTPSVQINVEGKPVMLHERRAYRRDVEMDEVVTITMGPKTLGEIEIPNRSHYICFAYRDPETGEEGLSTIQNEKLEYHPPLEEEPDEEESETAEPASADAVEAETED